MTNMNKEENFEITEGEKERILEIRGFTDLKENTLSYKIVLAVDRMRQQRVDSEIIIEKRLTDILALHSRANRLREQLDSGIIVEKLDDVRLMNKDELESSLRQQLFNAKAEAYTIMRDLAQLRGLVGRKDLIRKDIMTEEEFDKYANGVLFELKKFGYNFIGE